MRENLICGQGNMGIFENPFRVANPERVKPQNEIFLCRSIPFAHSRKNWKLNFSHTFAPKAPDRNPL
jgi:hypothetical protein